MGKFLDSHTLSNSFKKKQAHTHKKKEEETGNLKRSISIKWIELINVNPAIHRSDKNSAQIFPQNESSGTF